MQKYIREILEKHYKENCEKIFNNSDLIRYINLKSSAISGNSKARKSLASIYAVYSMLHFYIEEFYNKPVEYKEFRGYQFTKLLSFSRTLYGGEKLQNHSFNSRVNSEFKNKINSEVNKGKDIVVIDNRKYAIHIDYLYVGTIDISKVVYEIISKYIDLLQEKDLSLIAELELLAKAEGLEEKRNRILGLLNETAEARIFEIISYAILKNYYQNKTIFIGTSKNDIKEEVLRLYKTGRTNANDGGIDFVMRPLGRFFQVTEVASYGKYLLDIDKVLHFPITFVIKTNKSKEKIAEEIAKFIDKKSGGMTVIKDRYNKAIEEIITINELTEWFTSLGKEAINSIYQDIILYYKIEMNFFASIEE